MKKTAPTIAAACLLLVGITVWMHRPAAKPSRYHIVDLGTLGGCESYAYDINNVGQVVGQSEDALGEPHGFLWADGKMQDLGTLPDTYDGQPNSSKQSTAVSINNQGEVVGDSDLGIGNGSARGAYDAVAWNGGKPTDLGAVPGYGDSTANKVNAQGEIAGEGIEQEDGPTTHIYRACSVFFEHGTTRATGALPNGFTINDLGQSIGSIRHGGRFYLVLWKKGRVEAKTLIPNAKNLLASTLNNRGQAVVSLTDSGSDDPSSTVFYPLHSALWNRGQLRPLAAINGYPSTYARDINDSGQIVGRVDEAYSDKKKLPLHSLAVVWEGSAAKDLNRLIPAGSGWILEDATGINNRGQIVGFGKHDGKERGFLLTPVAASGSK